MTKKWQKNGGQAMLLATLFFLLISLIFVMGIIVPVLTQISGSENLILSKRGFYATEAGIEDVTYRLKKAQTVVSPVVLAIDFATATITVSDIAGGKQLTVSGLKDSLQRNETVTLASGNGAAFHYGLQAGIGGIQMNNNSTIKGNVFSNGPINATNNDINGDVISASPTGSINSVHATGTAYAHTISNSTIDKDAHYQVISRTTVKGNSYPGSADQATSSFPISDSQISDWETAAAAGGVISSPCPYKINSDVTLGPVKITCDLQISGSPTITLAGAVWVTGNISFSNTPNVKISPSLGVQSVALIADNPTDQINSSTIDIKNSVHFFGSGAPSSFVLLLSQNKSAERGGSVEAISAENSANGALLVYAGHGLVSISNNVSLKEVTAYKLETNNSSEVIYESGLVNLLFSSGPSGGYTISTWKETQ